MNLPTLDNILKTLKNKKTSTPLRSRSRSPSRMPIGSYNYIKFEHDGSYDPILRTDFQPKADQEYNFLNINSIPEQSLNHSGHLGLSSKYEFPNKNQHLNENTLPISFKHSNNKTMVDYTRLPSPRQSQQIHQLSNINQQVIKVQSATQTQQTIQQDQNVQTHKPKSQSQACQHRNINYNQYIQTEHQNSQSQSTQTNSQINHSQNQHIQTDLKKLDHNQTQTIIQKFQNQSTQTEPQTKQILEILQEQQLQQSTSSKLGYSQTDLSKSSIMLLIQRNDYQIFTNLRDMTKFEEPNDFLKFISEQLNKCTSDLNDWMQEEIEVTDRVNIMLGLWQDIISKIQQTLSKITTLQKKEGIKKSLIDTQLSNTQIDLQYIQDQPEDNFSYTLSPEHQQKIQKDINHDIILAPTIYLQDFEISPQQQQNKRESVVISRLSDMFNFSVKIHKVPDLMKDEDEDESVDLMKENNSSFDSDDNNGSVY